jgi:hypothetical protein
MVATVGLLLVQVAATGEGPPDTGVLEFEVPPLPNWP